MFWMHVGYYLLLLALLVAGLFVSILGLPGLWLMVGSAWGYAWLTGIGHYVGWATLWVLLGLAFSAEIAEFAAGSAGAKRAGGSRRAMFGAIVGALIGGFLLSIPIPVVGT